MLAAMASLGLPAVHAGRVSSAYATCACSFLGPWGCAAIAFSTKARRGWTVEAHAHRARPATNTVWYAAAFRVHQASHATYIITKNHDVVHAPLLGWPALRSVVVLSWGGAA